MEFNTMSLLTLLIGLVIGAIVIYILVVITGAGAGKKAEKLLEDARKQAEKQKRDNILEIKEESYRLKQELDNEIKAKKQEITSKDCNSD